MKIMFEDIFLLTVILSNYFHDFFRGGRYQKYSVTFHLRYLEKIDYNVYKTLRLSQLSLSQAWKIMTKIEFKIKFQILKSFPIF